MDRDKERYPAGAEMDGAIKSAMALLKPPGRSEEDFLKTSFILVKLLQNIISFPEDDRFRIIRRNSSILSQSGALEILHCAGFVAAVKNGIDNITCPRSASIDRVKLVKQCLLFVRQQQPPLEGMEIPVTSLRFGERLGKGKFGEVYIGTWDGVPIAVKTLRPNCEGQVVSSFHNEASMMRRLQHANIVQLRAVALMVDPCLIVLELMAAPLLAQLHDGAASSVQVQVARVREVALGMEFMHSKHIIHCDLAARNVLVDRNNRLRIADFGLARECESGVCPPAANDRVFPIRWTAPEVLMTAQRSKPADVWSFGILFFEITTAGSVPYSNFTNPETKQKVKEGYRLPSPEGCPDDVYHLMNSCWNAAPVSRPTFAAIAVEMRKLQEKYDAQPSASRAASTSSSDGRSTSK